MCNDHDLLIGYVYGELSEAERRSFEAHLAGCASCDQEVQELRATRVHLASWAPPEPDLGFRVVRSGDAAAVRRAWFVPVWGLAAAAVLVLAAAAAIAHVEVRYDASGFTVRTGWGAGAAANAGTETDTPPASAKAAEAATAQLATLEARVRELEAAAARQPSGAAAPAAGPRMSDAEVMRRVRESETRLQRDFALQLARVVTDVDRALQVNYVRINQGLGQHREETQAEVARQLNYYLTRVSNQR